MKRSGRRKTVVEKKEPTEQKINITKTLVVKQDALLLDFLLANLTKMSRNNVKKILTGRCVLVDGVVTTRHDFALTRKNTVQISKSPILKEEKKYNFKLDIIYEDDEFIVINKPSGLLSIADDKENFKTAYHYILERQRARDPKNQIFIVHRIDKETSGVLMVAKNKEIRDALQDSWNDIVKEREYYAVVEGVFKEKTGTIKSYLTETKTHMVYSSKGKTGKLAITNYQTIKYGHDYSLLRVNIDSGRKNQIRVHMAESGHPIAGDQKYGGHGSNLKRLGLHASKLVFIHPINHKEYKFEAKVPQQFISVIK